MAGRNKQKGSKAERELLKKFVEDGWMAIRVAGSGILPDPSCDLIAGKRNKKHCIEVKSSKAKIKYLDKKQVENFLYFSEIFGLKPLLAIRFNQEGWFFLKPKYLEKTKSGLKIDLKRARKKGKRFGQAFS